MQIIVSIETLIDEVQIITDANQPKSVEITIKTLVDKIVIYNVEKQDEANSIKNQITQELIKALQNLQTNDLMAS
jgi:hypothetical protein